jgi:hypothetical protein
MSSNDLCRKKQKVVRNILSYTQYLHDGIGVQQVIVDQLLRRQPWASRRNFNADVVNTNNLLKKRLVENNIHFWFWMNISYLGRKGVHIEKESGHMKKYLHSIRIAIFHHSR